MYYHYAVSRKDRKEGGGEGGDMLSLALEAENGILEGALTGICKSLWG